MFYLSAVYQTLIVMEFAAQPKLQNTRYKAAGANTVSHAGKNGFHFTDNRPQAAIQRKMYPTQTVSPIQLMAIGNGIIQMATDEELDAMADDIINNRKEDFKRRFRAAAPGMDEEISCQVTFEHGRSILSQGKPAIKTFLSQSDKLRLPTSMTAHHVTMTDGTESRMVHPTSKDTMLYGADVNAKGNPRWTGHTTFDRGRAAYVRGGTDVDEFKERAVEYTLGSGAQPPFAKNSVSPKPLTDTDARAAHLERERIKSLHPDYDASKKQDYDAAWYPDSSKRGVSPVRELP